MAKLGPHSRKRLFRTGVGVLIVILLVFVRWGPGWFGGAKTAVDRADGPALADAASEPGSDRDTPVLQARSGTGDVDVQGRIVDTAGGPVRGIAIAATIEMGPGVGARGDDPRLASVPPVVAISGSDGGFVLQGLEAGRYLLQASGPGIVPAEVRFVEVPVTSLQVVVAREVPLVGRVVHEGRPVAGAEVMVVSEYTGGMALAMTDASGGFSVMGLSEGVFRVRGAKEALVSQSVQVERFGVGPFTPVELILESGVAIAGKVVDGSTGRGIAARVILTPHSALDLPHYVRSNADGFFSVRGVRAGRWSLQSTSPGYWSGESVEFDAAASLSPTVRLQPGAVIEGVLSGYERGGLADGTVTLRGKDVTGKLVVLNADADAADYATLDSLGSSDADGQESRFVPSGELGVLLGPIPFPPPAGSGRVAVAMRIVAPGSVLEPQDLYDVDDDADLAAWTSATAQRRSSFRTDSQGRFRITGVPPGRYRLEGRHADFATGQSAEFRVRGGQVPRDLELRRGVSLWGLVTDDSGAPVVGATLVANLQGEGDISVQAVTGSDGRYRMAPIGVDVAVRVTAAKHGEARRTLALSREAGHEREENFLLATADRRLYGRVRTKDGNAVVGATVTVAARDRLGSPRSAETQADGRFEITGLATAEYAYTVTHSDFPELKSRARTEVEHEVVLSYGGGVDGMVRQAGSLAALSDAQVSLRGKQAGTNQRTVSGSDGGFEFLPVAGGEWTLEVVLPGYVSYREQVDVPVGRSRREITLRDIRVELTRAARVSGVVRDDNGDRLSGVLIQIGSVKTRSDAHGEFSLVDVATGSVEVALTYREHAKRVQLELSPGQEVTTLDVVLP